MVAEGSRAGALKVPVRGSVARRETVLSVLVRHLVDVHVDRISCSIDLHPGVLERWEREGAQDIEEVFRLLARGPTVIEDVSTIILPLPFPSNTPGVIWT